MIAVDTNILVHAHRAESEWHEIANKRLSELATDRWAIAWPCIHEFIAIVTHPKIFVPPTPLADALRAVESWRAAPTLTLLAEGTGYWEIFAELVRVGRVVGPRTHDARIAAICTLHGVSEIWTADRDFSRFKKLKIANPLV